MATIHDRLVAALQKRGAQRPPNSRVSRYTVLQLPGQADFYFVGRAGALRRGKTTATSIPADTTKAKLLAET